jgi:hypothetical protein
VSPPGRTIVQSSSLGGQRGVRLRLGLEVGTHRLRPGGRIGGPHRADHQVAPHAGAARGVEQLDRGAEVDRALALGPAARPRAGGEDDRVGPLDVLRDVVERLEVGEHGLRAGGVDAGRVARVADERARGVAARGQQPRQAQRDPPVAAGDDDGAHRENPPAVLTTRTAEQ